MKTATGTKSNIATSAPPHVLGNLQIRVLAILLLACMAAHVSWMSPALLGFLVLVIGLRVLWQSRIARPISQWVRSPLFVVTLAMVYITTGSPLGRDGGVALLISLAALKLVESHSIRDGRMLIAALFFVAMTQFLFSQGLLVTIWIGAIAVAAFAGLTLLRKYPEPDLAVGGLRAGARALRGIARMAVAAVPLAAVVFLFFPRLGQPLWGAPWNANESRTGISDEMRPGMISKLWSDDSPAFRVSFEGEIPRAQDLYWRGPVLWNFDGQTWSRAIWASATQGIAMTYDPSTLVRYEVLLEATERQWYFPLDLPTTTPAEARVLIDGQMVVARSIISPKRMQLESAIGHQFDVDPPAHHLSAARRLPAGSNPKAYALAQRWRQQGMDDNAVIKAALAMFNASFSYSLEPPPLTPGRSVDEFLFDTQIGYCEHYASAFAFLMRSAGIPTRVVTGYQGGYINRSGGYLLVRNSDAHAWTEVWLAGRGWTRVDPTSAVAPERIDRGSLSQAMPSASRWFEQSWTAPWVDRVDVVARWWRQRIVDFDARRQRHLLTPFGIESADLRTLVIALAITGGLALAFGAWWSLRGLGKGTRDPLLSAWRRYGRRLERAGVSRAIHEGPIEFSRRAAAAQPKFAGTILRLGKEFARLRYAGDSEFDIKDVKALIKALRGFKIGRR